MAWGPLWDLREGVGSEKGPEGCAPEYGQAVLLAGLKLLNAGAFLLTLGALACRINLWYMDTWGRPKLGDNLGFLPRISGA